MTKGLNMDRKHSTEAGLKLKWFDMNSYYKENSEIRDF